MFIFLFSCSKKIEEIKSYQIPNYIQKVSNGEIVEYEFDKKNWEILADSIIELNGYYIVLKFRLKFYNNNQFSGILIGDSGVMEKNSRNMKAYRNVIFKSRDSSFLKTNKLYWNDIIRKIYTDDSVYIYDAKNKRELWGIGFESDDEFKHIRIFRNVRGKGEGNLTK